MTEHRGPVQIAAVLLLVCTLGASFILAMSSLRNAVGDGAAYGALVAPLVEFLHNFPVKQFVFFFGLTAVLAVVLPATRKDRFLSKSLALDFIWFLYEHTYLVLIMATYAVWLSSAFETHLGFLTTDALQSWPVWAKLALGLVLADFVRWLHHMLMHRVPVLWKFHKVHHSQREINFFTNSRNHLVDNLTYHLMSVLPFLLLSFEIPQIYLIMVFVKWHPMLIHANVRTNLGPLKYILVTPQSHRVHHSSAPEHHDMNYGVVLSIWDHMFGTQIRDYEIYPETGLKESFPVEQDHPWWRLPFLPVWQMLYPFREIAADLGRRRNSTEHPARTI